jgi:hypothetical protein
VKRDLGPVRMVDVDGVESAHERCRCEKCGAEIAARADVARCANLRDELDAALDALSERVNAVVELEQTGGMCCATAITFEHAGVRRLLCATALEGPLLLCSYEVGVDPLCEPGWDWEQPTHVLTSNVVADVVAAVLVQLRAWAR